MTASGTWTLEESQRQETVRRTSENLFALAYSRGSAVSDKEAAEAAKIIEKKAYAIARIESQTTTGHRPHEESLKAYIRQLAALLLERVSAGKVTQTTSTISAEAVDLTGDREFMTKETAEQALAPLFAEGSAVKRIKLSTKSFGVNPDNSAEVAARAIEASAASLTDVDLSDVIAGRPEAHALAALKTLSQALSKLQLRSLDLSDNALGEKGIRACAAAFSDQRGLEFLAFQNVGCSINACAAVKELLKHPGQLRTFHFYNNMSDDAGAASIADVLMKAPNMEDFKMGSSRVGAEGGSALARGLQAGQKLVKLDLSDNPMTSDVAEALATLVRRQPHLKVLNLNDTSLGDDGVSAIADALAESAEQLEELELALNEITAEGAKAVAGMLGKKSSLRKLNLRENELEDSGALLIARGISNLASLETVDLTQNQIRRAGAVTIAKAVTKSKGLKMLALDENEINENGIDALKGVLEHAGLAAALGPLDENDADVDEEEEDEEQNGTEVGEDELTAAFAKAGITD